MKTLIKFINSWQPLSQRQSLTKLQERYMTRSHGLFAPPPSQNFQHPEIDNEFI